MDTPHCGKHRGKASNLIVQLTPNFFSVQLWLSSEGTVSFPRSCKAVSCPACTGLALFSLLLSGTHLRLLSAMVFRPWRKCDVPLGIFLLICPFPCPPEVACRFWVTKLSLFFNVESFVLFPQHFCYWLLLPTPLLMGLPVYIKLGLSMELLNLINYSINYFLNPEICQRNSTILTKLNELFLFLLFVSCNLVVLILV